MPKVDGGYIHPSTGVFLPGRKKERMGMCGFLYWIFLLVLAFAMPAGGHAQGTKEPPRSIILIGWDGAQRNHVKECLGRGELPNLKQLSVAGTIVAIDILRTTATKPGWAQILTGYEPEVTGVFNNRQFGPIPKGYTIFERLKKFFGPQNFAAGAIMAKKGNLGAQPPRRWLIHEEGKARKEDHPEIAGKIIVEGGRKYILIPAEPYYYTKDGMDTFLNGLIEDRKVAAKACEWLDQYQRRPFFLFVHFNEVDRRGHQFGENSKEYNDALIAVDTWTGKIIEKVKKLSLHDKTLVYVTADHGFDEGLRTHHDAPYVFLATNDRQVIRRGFRVDIAPTILDRFGLDLNKIDPPLSGKPLTKPYQPPRW
jgi:predicted AlkP superfamily phosphohydrolase/phosphomutase